MRRQATARPFTVLDYSVTTSDENLDSASRAVAKGGWKTHSPTSASNRQSAHRGRRRRGPIGCRRGVGTGRCARGSIGTESRPDVPLRRLHQAGGLQGAHFRSALGHASRDARRVHVQGKDYGQGLDDGVCQIGTSSPPRRMLWWTGSSSASSSTRTRACSARSTTTRRPFSSDDEASSSVQAMPREVRTAR